MGYLPKKLAKTLKTPPTVPDGIDKSLPRCLLESLGNIVCYQLWPMRQCWMAQNFLQLNENKTEGLLFGPPDSIKSTTSSLGNLSILVKPHVKNLGVIFNSTFKFHKQGNAVVKAGFFLLRTITKFKTFPSPKELEKVIHAFTSSRLDSCNSLYTGIRHSSLSRLQLAQNAAARLLTGTRKRDHISPIQASLHWFPVRFRIDLKVLLFVFKALNEQAPSYISDLLTPYSTARSLRSSNLGLLAVPRPKLKSRGDRAFAVAAPRLWNSLPLSVRSAPSIDSFKSRLKTHLYSLAFGSS